MTKVAVVTTSHSDLGDTGKKTGLWFEELAAPYYVFKDKGYDVVVASIKGGDPPVDAGSLSGNSLNPPLSSPNLFRSPSKSDLSRSLFFFLPFRL